MNTLSYGDSKMGTPCTAKGRESPWLRVRAIALSCHVSSRALVHSPVTLEQEMSESLFSEETGSPEKISRSLIFEGSSPYLLTLQWNPFVDKLHRIPRHYFIFSLLNIAKEYHVFGVHYKKERNGLQQEARTTREEFGEAKLIVKEQKRWLNKKKKMKVT